MKTLKYNVFDFIRLYSPLSVAKNKALELVLLLGERKKAGYHADIRLSMNQ